MATLTGTDAPVAARCAAPGWMRWACSARDGLADVFPIEDSQRDRWPQAACTHTVGPAALGPAAVAGPRCPRCALAVAGPGAAGSCVLVPQHPGHGGRAAGAAVAAARPIMLVRYRPGVTGETARVVHVVPLPTDEQAGAVGAVCGAALMLADIETVNPGDGMPCTVCLVTHVMGTAPDEEPPADSPADGPGAGLATGGTCYQQWDWPVIVHRDQVRLSLYRDVSALAIPIPLATEVTQILTQRRCAPPVLAHPYTPDHHILLTGEGYGVPLPWPPQVHQVTGVLLLPPTVTPRGPITWIQPPRPDSLRLCREIDLFGALRTTLSDSPPRDPLPGGDPP